MGKTHKDWTYGDQPPRDWRETADILKGEQKKQPKPKKRDSSFHAKLKSIEQLLKEKKHA